MSRKIKLFALLPPLMKNALVSDLPVAGATGKGPRAVLRIHLNSFSNLHRCPGSVTAKSLFVTVISPKRLQIARGKL